MKQISKTFLKGLIAVVPITITFYLLFWLAVTAELVLGNIFKFFLPTNWYVEGFGFVLGLAVIFFVGGFLESETIEKYFQRAEQYIVQVPVIKSIYTAIRDFISIFSNERGKKLRQVVLIDVPAGGGKQVGFITSSDFPQFSSAIDIDDQIAVYLPFSYQIGGFTVIMPRTAITEVDMSVEDALRFVATAGVVGEAKIDEIH
jgi:uncharacterized membrane protein